MNGMMTLQQVLAWLPGGVPHGDTGVVMERVHTDTRSLRAGDLFVALKGEHYDANQFLVQAKAGGAVAALCHPGADLASAGLPGIEVPDTKKALGQLGKAWRAQFTLPLVAVTGSNGKTTVTQMLAAILRAWKPSAMLATQGNFNNDIGLPLTLLRLRGEHEIAALELGMNHPGEIALLADMARPTVALVNNAQREHLEFMGTLDAVARENGSVLCVLPQDGVAVFPHDDSFTPLWRTLARPRRVMTFATQPATPAGAAAAADVTCEHLVWTDAACQVHAGTPAGPLDFTLHMAGNHNVHNALAAATCALAVGVPLDAIRRGLESFVPVKGRSRAVRLEIDRRQIMRVDDSYNATPDSVQAALELLASLPAPRLMVLGDMGEVGDQGAMFHLQAGTQARELGIESLFTLGALSAHSSQQLAAARHFDTMPALVAAVLAELPRVASVLVKGARFMKMEQVVEAVSARAQDRQAAAGGVPPCC